MVKREDKYAWSVGSRPPAIDPHSLVKHDIVRDYLGRYIQVLMSNYVIDKLTLSIVDGFAGGGEYSSETGKGFHDGSPLIALDAVQEQEVRLNIGRVKPRTVDTKYYFVEKLSSNFEYLQRLLLAHRLSAGRVGKDVLLFKNRFEEVAESIIADIRRRRGGERAIFLLDQYSYDQVSGSLLHRIFSQLKKPEVILTFNVDSLISFLSDREQSRRKLAAMGLEKYIDWTAIEKLKSAPSGVWRAAIQRNLARGLVEVSGARHYTIFYITPIGNTPWTYWLVHLTNSYKARDVMMELHWERANHFSHNLEPDIFTLGYHGNSDSIATRQESMDLGETHHFDAMASARCKKGLTEKMIPAIYDRSTPMPFGEVLETVGSKTPGTASMIREALDPAIRSGDIVARSLKGAKRTKGSSLESTDILTRSNQMPISFSFS